jgi:hypothetical protein
LVTPKPIMIDISAAINSKLLIRFCAFCMTQQA